MSPIVAAVWLLHGLKGVKTSQGGRPPSRCRRLRRLRRRRRRKKKGWRKTDEKLRKIPEGRSVHGTPTNQPTHPCLCSFRHIRPSGVTIVPPGRRTRSSESFPKDDSRHLTAISSRPFFSPLFPAPSVVTVLRPRRRRGGNLVRVIRQMGVKRGKN